MRWLLVGALLLIGCSSNPPKIPHFNSYDFHTAVKPGRATKYAPVTVILVPGWQHEHADHETDLSDLHEIRDELRRAGIKHRYAWVSSKNRQADNARTIARTIRATPGPIIIITASRSTSEAAIAIADLSAHNKKRIVRWISVSGVVYGSPIADFYTTPALAPGANIWAKSLGNGDVENIREMRRDVSRKRMDKLAPKLQGVPAISVVSEVSNCSGITGFSLVGGCVIVAATGLPNDGVVLTQDQIIPGSLVLTAKGHKHMLNPHAGGKMIADLVRMVLESA